MTCLLWAPIGYLAGAGTVIAWGLYLSLTRSRAKEMVIVGK